MKSGISKVLVKSFLFELNRGIIITVLAVTR